MTHKPAGAGKSSIDLVDWQKVTQLIDVQSGHILLDLACGAGRYSLAFADHIGAQGKIYAVDLWEDGLTQLQLEAQERAIDWIETEVSDIRKAIPVSANSVDLGLLATALHDIPDQYRSDLAKEIFRVLKPGGVINIIEFKKELSGPPGPPPHIRISPEDIAEIFKPLGFEHKDTNDVGPYVLLSQFSKPA